MQIKKLGLTKAFKHWREIYGDVYGMYFGVIPNFIVSDPEFIQEVLVKRFSNFTNRSVSVKDEISNVALTTAKDDHWKYLRTVLTPSFTSHQMRAMNAMIQTCADNLVENIDKLAENGEETEVKKYVKLLKDSLLIIYILSLTCSSHWSAAMVGHLVAGL
uniref:Cytochrome P450 n=1 Tax=Octopus bimaculoides TaxID=37653 RepID=A0A0L8I507_OCTBM